MSDYNPRVEYFKQFPNHYTTWLESELTAVMNDIEVGLKKLEKNKQKP